MPELMSSQQCVEYICQQGCTVVRDIIVKLEQQRPVEGLEHLNTEQTQQILVELKLVMSVYDQQ